MKTFATLVITSNFQSKCNNISYNFTCIYCNFTYNMQVTICRATELLARLTNNQNTSRSVK